MATKKIGNLEFTVKANGRIDYDKPPKGKVFVPVPTDEENIKLRGIDRRFVTRHKFSATTELVVMELIDEVDEGGAKAFIAEIKRGYKNEERKNRCQIKSLKTGAWICCPDCISCYGDKCAKKKGQEVRSGRPDSLDIPGMAETIKSSIYSDDPTADEAIVNHMWETFLEKLRKEDRDLAKIAQWDEEGYNAKEILKALRKTEKYLSWFYRQKEKIRDRWIEYNAD